MLCSPFLCLCSAFVIHSGSVGRLLSHVLRPSKTKTLLLISVIIQLCILPCYCSGAIALFHQCHCSRKQHMCCSSVALLPLSNVQSSASHKTTSNCFGEWLACFTVIYCGVHLSDASTIRSLCCPNFPAECLSG